MKQTQMEYEIHSEEIEPAIAQFTPEYSELSLKRFLLNQKDNESY